MNEPFDFSGWATKNNIRCSDGRVILKDAFIENDGKTVPLVWNHQHNDPSNVLGHALLENRDDGVFAYCTFNDTENGELTKVLVNHGDINALSIFANQISQQGSNVVHGNIREVSLVHAGANPGAFIESVIRHGEMLDDEAIIYTGEEFTIEHSLTSKKKSEETKYSEEDGKTGSTENTDENENETLEDVFNSLSDKQKDVVFAMIGQIFDESDPEEKDDRDNENKSNDNEPNKEDNKMKHNVFDSKNTTDENAISHSDMMAVISDAKRYGSMKDSAIAHGIENIDYLFPDAKTINNAPEFIQREMGWVQKVMSAMHHTPFSRIKSVFADITEDDARAKGYLKGKQKKDEVFALLKRTTSPTTVYKKQKLDRDDVLDITDFDVVAWLKTEMRMMLDEEIARAALVGDGRSSSSDDKINEQNIRPIWTDEDLYTIKALVDAGTNPTADALARAFIRSAVKARKDYKGSGEPTLYTTEDVLTDCLLMEDTTGRVIYDSVTKLAAALRVKEIVTVPVMEGLTRTDTTNGKVKLMGIIVNLADYNIGADKGGAVNMFDDFDIDYNAQKYLIETRCSGALIKPYSAIVMETKENP